MRGVSENVGVYSGTFDPPHDGHRAFVDAAIERCGLDAVYILPEPSPRGKSDVTPNVHRTAMATLMFDQDVCRVRTIEAAPITLGSVKDTIDLPEQFYLLLGSDAALHLAEWDDISAIIERATFIIGLRQACDETQLRRYLDELSVPESRVVIIKTDFADYGSTHARSGQIALHEKIADYVHKHSLYEV